MDETLIRRAALAGALCAGLVGLAGSGAHAQELQDPTRPPAAMTAMTSSPSAPGGGPQLQTILIGRGNSGRHLAVIDGATVQIGDTVRGARVTRIGDNEVELKRGGERQVLRLYAQDVPGGITPAARPAGR